MVSTFVNDTAIMAFGDNNTEFTEKLQTAIDDIQRWAKKLQMKLNESKCVHIEFTNKKVEHKPVSINNQSVPSQNKSKYLGMALNCARWKAYVKTKQEELN